MDGQHQGLALTPIGITYQQQVSAAVLHELIQSPRFKVQPPLDRIDHRTLVAETILHSVAQVGIGGSASDYALEGATKDDLIFFMVDRVADQIAFFKLEPVPALEITGYCIKLLDQLLRQGPNAPPPDQRGVLLFGRAKPLQFEIFRERYAANGRDVVIIASEYATNAIFQCLSNDITDIVAANQFMIKLQLERKEYDRMASHLKQQIRISQSFRAEILQLLNRVRYEIRATTWADHLSETVGRVRRQANEVIDQDHLIRNGLLTAVEFATNKDRALLREIEALGSIAFSSHATINGDVIRLHEEFIDNKSTRAMRVPNTSILHDHEDDILRPLLRLDKDLIGRQPIFALDLLLKPELPVSSDPVPWLSLLLNMRKMDDQSKGDEEDADFGDATGVEDERDFSERDEITVDSRLLQFAEELGRPFLLSDFLTWFEKRGATEAQLHLSCLFVSTIFINTSRRWSIELVPERDHAGKFDIPSRDTAFIAGRLFGSNFNILLLDRNEENYTRETDRSE
jgi:hypothetical protein